MPLGALAAGAIGSGVDLISNLAMYGLERAGNISMWKKQNEYNHPVQQVQRLKEAGLNPALIYGGSTGQASGMAGPITPARINESKPGSSALSFMSQIYDLEIKKNTADNLLEQNKVLQYEGVLKQILGDRALFDLGLEKDTRIYSLEARRESARKLGIENQFQLDENERRTVLNAVNVQKGVEDVLMSRAARAKTEQETRNLQEMLKVIRTEGLIKELDYKLYLDGVPPGSPFWWKTLGVFLQTIAKEPGGVGKALRGLFNRGKSGW